MGLNDKFMSVSVWSFVLGMELLGLTVNLRLCRCGQIMSGVIQRSGCGATGLERDICDCVSVTKIQMFQLPWCCWALRLCQCGQNSMGFVAMSVWSNLKSFSSRGAVGLCDCASVVKTREFQFPLCYLGLNDNFVTVSVVKIQVFQFLWC